VAAAVIVLNPRYAISYGRRYLRVWRNGRILYFSDRAEPGVWESRWKGLITRDYYKRYERGELGELTPFAEKVFGKDDRILEAGCGSGRLVVALLARGFKNVEGVEREPQTVARAKEIFPSLPVRAGDVLEIDRPNDHYDGYISLGVVEHRMEGPEPFLQEAWRVLKPGGHALISVPYINLLRNLKCGLGLIGRAPGRETVFYQYAFTKTEFLGVLRDVGFEVVEVWGTGGFNCLRQELPLLLNFLSILPGGQHAVASLKSSQWIDRLGHMILFVCRKRLPRERPQGATQFSPAV
jgi:SAM-dependent methyltransferase